MLVTDIGVELAVKTLQTVRLQTSASVVPLTLCLTISSQRPMMNSERKELVKCMDICTPIIPVNFRLVKITIYY